MNCDTTGKCHEENAALFAKNHQNMCYDTVPGYSACMTRGFNPRSGGGDVSVSSVL